MAHHHHGHGGCDHSHEDPVDPALVYSLYQKIDINRVQCYNEHEEGAGAKVFKPWEDRLDTTKYVQSDVDEELLFNIPFTGSVKLKGLIMMGEEGPQHPREVRLFKNRQPQGFDQLGGEPEQVIQIAQQSGSTEYQVKVSKFNGVESLALHIPSNYGDEITKVYYIGLRGDFTEINRREVVVTSYEAAPNPADHKTKLFQPTSAQIK